MRDLFGNQEGSALTCRVCHRKLSDPASIACGVGPVCRGKGGALKHAGAYRTTMSEREIECMEPRDSLEEFLFERTDGGARFNFPQRIYYHSPSGMEYGYGGSGPADAALNVLIHFVDGREALRLHQEFKWDYIARLPECGGRIPAAAVREWIRRRQAKQEG
jgi:hypothetical protein